MIIDVILANINLVVKKGSLAVLENQDHIRVLEEVASGLILEAVVCRLQPHVVLVDEAIPGIDIFDVIPQIRRLAPETRFIVYTDRDTLAHRERCLASGIDGLLVKVPSFTRFTPSVGWPGAKPFSRGSRRTGRKWVTPQQVTYCPL